LGSKTYPYDIDLFISRKDVAKAFELLRPLSITEIHEWDNRYLEFQGKCDGIPFEICEWEEEPKKIMQKKFKDFDSFETLKEVSSPTYGKYYQRAFAIIDYNEIYIQYRKNWDSYKFN